MCAMATPASSDEYLNAVSGENSITVAELCATRVWQRVDGGYKVLDRETVEMTLATEVKRTLDAQFCQATDGHEPSDEDPDLCRKCSAWRPSAEDWFAEGT